MASDPSLLTAPARRDDLTTIPQTAAEPRSRTGP